MELLEDHGLLDSRFTAIHAIHISARDRLLGARSGGCVRVSYHRAQPGHGTTPADRFLDVRVPIALGSDSNVQINLLEDARSLEYHLRMQQLQCVVLAEEPSREALAQGLAAFATQAGSESLGAPGGSLEVGRPADFFSVDLSGPSIADAGPESLASHLVFSLERTAIRDVCLGGEFVVRDGPHPYADEIVRKLSDLQRTLWGSPERNLE